MCYTHVHIPMWSETLVNTIIHMCRTYVYIICIRIYAHVVNTHMHIRTYVHMYICMSALHIQINEPLSRFSPTDPGPSALNFSLNLVTSPEKSSTCCLVICTIVMMSEQVAECEWQIVQRP